MKNKILIVYQFATFGGVERVLLNRAEAFKFYKEDYKLFIYFYEDYGAKNSLINYIKQEELSEYIEIIDSFEPDDYDYIISIDTPQLFEDKKINSKNVYIETHTFERKCRFYLDKYMDVVKKVIVPSDTFFNSLKDDYCDYQLKKIFVLPNFVPWDMKKNEEKLINLPCWGKKIIFYYGRMDENKNIKELIDAVDFYINNINEEIILILAGKIDPDYNLKIYIDNKNMNKNIIILPPVNFNKISLFLNTMKFNKGLFVSSSKGESFGLSAAEAIACSIPVVLSNIQAHEKVVKSNINLLYSLNNPQELAVKIDYIFNNYEVIQKEIDCYKDDFSAKEFIDCWKKIFPKKELEDNHND